MKKLREWLDERAAKKAAADAITELATSEKRELTADEAKKFDELIAEIDEMDGPDGHIERARKVEELAKRRAFDAPAIVTATGDPVAPVNEKRNFKLMRAIQLKTDGKNVDGFEGEVLEEGAKNARMNGIDTTADAFYVTSDHLQKRGQTVTLQTTNPGDQGGVTVPTDTMPLLDQLWSQTWLSQVGARFMTGLTGNPRFPVQKTKPTVSELTEIEEMGYTEILFSDFQMSPKRRGATIPISKQLILQSSVDIEALVIENISKAIAQYMNVEAIGIVLGAITSGNNNLLALGTNGAAPTYENLVDLEALVDAKDALLFSPAYLTNPKVKAKLKKTQVFTGTSGEPVWDKGNLLNGYPTIVSNLIPSNLTKGTASGTASAIVFGNFRDLYVGLWGGVEFIVDPYSAKKKAQVEITANTFYDIKVARPESFAGIKDALTA